MNDQPDDAPAFDPSDTGGGAVDDLTPPSQRQFDPSKALSQSRIRIQQRSSGSLTGVELSSSGTIAGRRYRKTEIAPRNVPRSATPTPAGMIASPGMGDEIQIQDLTQEQLLR